MSALLIGLLVIGCSTEDRSPPPPKPLNPDDPKGLLLGPGVPRVVDTNGNVIDIDRHFTTGRYQLAALQLMLAEATQVATALRLPETLPLTLSNLTEAFVTPFGYHYRRRSLGTITTSNYVYIFSKENRFNEIVAANYDKTCLALEHNSLLLERMDFTEPYQLATQWLAAVSMDVSSLNRECKPHVAVSPFWNGLTALGQTPGKTFVPIYYVWWTSPQNDDEKFGSVASVELYGPSRKLIQLHVSEPKYILRRPLQFTNLASLFPGTAPVRVFTNYPPTDHHVYRPGH